MNQKDLAADYLNEAKIRFKTAKDVIENDYHAFCFRLCQEATELALKAALRLAGIDFPKWHDIGKLLEKEKNKFPKSFHSGISKLASISEKLADKRELAMYGDEQDTKPLSNLFNEEMAKSAIDDANYCLEKVGALFTLFLEENQENE